MGNSGSKINFRKAVIELTSKKSKVEEDAFWEELWASNINSAADVFALITADDVRSLRDNSPNNLAALCYKTVGRITTACNSPSSMSSTKVLNCVRLLTRVCPYLFEDSDWKNFFWSVPPAEENEQFPHQPLACTLVSALTDLLFCPEFTVSSLRSQPEGPDDLSAIDSCEYIWEAGVGFATRPPQIAEHDQRRTEILKLLLACFSEVIYVPDIDENRMRWIARFTSAENRHVLPLFTSLLNVVCAYDPIGYGVPYNYLLFTDSREPLMQTALQVLIVCLDSETQSSDKKNEYADNFFINYLSRIHREEDFEFMLKGMTRLLTNPLVATYLPSSTKKITCHQELLVLLWKCCEYNQKFMFYLLKTSDVLEVLVPILFHISASRNDPVHRFQYYQSVAAHVYMNDACRLQTMRYIQYICMKNGLLQVFHKLITTGNHRLQTLFDCLLTIIVNVSPYLKSISMVAANKLIHLIEAFSTPWFLFSSPTNHLLIFFLLEVLNNIIQYQFDGNSNLVYTIIRKRQVFYQLANLSSDSTYIMKMLQGRKGRKSGVITESKSSITTGKPVGVVENKANIKATLAETPQVSTMTEKGMNDLGHESDDVQEGWVATTDWVESWKSKLPLQTVMRLLQVLVPQVEKICIDKGLTDESEILKFLQHGTLVGLLPVPHPILIRKYQANAGTNHWFRTYLWGVIYLRNIDPPIWYDTNVRLFEIQKA
ncbi:HID-1 protein, variant [Loa loa]|uniref:HID-1 protein, variant n=1 Tax=Loa loa TaxID=7209 RepID=A0A1S0UJE6_LOALO|nr:HID-1 protein, variant [Loa loa]EJD75810.1 HID-1 protein, variant [Loa loa]